MMLENGTRSNKLQLCFSNPDLRKLMTDRVLGMIDSLEDGVYMVGAEDHPGKFCRLKRMILVKKEL